MKVLFLDIDGVLNSSAWAERHGDGWNRRFDPLAVERLERILRETGCAIVVSSSWRVGRTLEQCRAELACAGIGRLANRRIVALTPDHNEPLPGSSIVLARPRGDEIDAWLQAHPDVTSYVILDDNDDMGKHEHRLVQTTWNRGLEDHHARRAIEMFQQPSGHPGGTL